MFTGEVTGLLLHWFHTGITGIGFCLIVLDL